MVLRTVDAHVPNQSLTMVFLQSLMLMLMLLLLWMVILQLLLTQPLMVMAQQT